MNRIFEDHGKIVFENMHTEISISVKDASVLKILDKKTGRDLVRERTAFFSLWTRDSEIPVTNLAISSNVITVFTKNGSFDVRAEAHESYFTFEVLTALPALASILASLARSVARSLPRRWRRAKRTRMR